MKDKTINSFLSILCGKFSNSEQAIKYPSLYANINIYFRKLPWSLMNGISIYSEQSYSYSPWQPYRQAVLKVYIRNGIICLDNYKLKNPNRIAGGGFNLEILSEIKNEDLSLRENCEMNFHEKSAGNYEGSLKKGNQCIIIKDNIKTFLVSSVKVNKDRLICIDEGFNVETKKKVWGSDNGPLKFNRILESE